MIVCGQKKIARLKMFWEEGRETWTANGSSCLGKYRPFSVQGRLNTTISMFICIKNPRDIGMLVKPCSGSPFTHVFAVLLSSYQSYSGIWQIFSFLQYIYNMLLSLLQYRLFNNQLASPCYSATINYFRSYNFLLLNRLSPTPTPIRQVTIIYQISPLVITV